MSSFPHFNRADSLNEQLKKQQAIGKSKMEDLLKGTGERRERREITGLIRR